MNVVHTRISDTLESSVWNICPGEPRGGCQRALTGPYHSRQEVVSELCAVGKDTRGSEPRSRTRFLYKNYFCLFRWTHSRSALPETGSGITRHLQWWNSRQARLIGRIRDFPTPPGGGGRMSIGKMLTWGGGFKGFSSKKRASTATFWSQVYNAYYSFLFAQILVLDFVQLKLKKVVYIPLG